MPAPSLFRAAPRLVLCPLSMLASAIGAQSWVPSSPFPAWGAGAPANVTVLAYDPSLTAQQNGAALELLAEGMQPGESLSVGPGTWSVPNRFDLSIQGTASQPVRIFATDPNDPPVITRPNAAQNCLNIGSNGVSRYLILQNLEFTGGGDIIRIYDGSYTWIDRCHLHDGGGVGIAVQTHSCSDLFITRNEVARPGPGTNGEAMYLGGNWGSISITDSVVALNYVHDTRGAVQGQGDGIELKQGSTRNWIVGNHVHDCQNPCILVYGTGGVDENVVEHNLMYDSDDAVLQVQGEAVVRNNIAIGGLLAFQSHDHQGVSSNLRVVHNTFVSAGRAANLGRWGSRPGMVVANNVMYSTSSHAVWFGIGDAGVTAAGNVIFGPINVSSPGYSLGSGLGDFVNVSLQTFAFDARPVAGGPIDNRGDPTFHLPLDVAGAVRGLPADPGALTDGATLTADVVTLPTSGGVQQLTLDLGPDYQGAGYLLAASTRAVPSGFVANGFHVPVQPDWLFVTSVTGGLPGTFQNGIGTLGASGRANPAVVIPPAGPAAAGFHIELTAFVARFGFVAHVSNTVPLTLQ